MSLKKCVAVCVAAALLVNTCSSQIAVFASGNVSNDFFVVREECIRNYPDDVELIDQVIDLVTNDPNFVAIYDNYPEEALDMLKSNISASIHEQSGIDTYAYESRRYYSYFGVPVVKQAEDWYCCPASFIAALIGTTAFTDTETNKGKAMQDTIAEELGVTEGQGAPPVYEVRDCLNKHFSGKPYGYHMFTNVCYKQSIKYMADALEKEYIPLVRVTDTSAFKYYNGKKLSHYVAVSAVDYSKKTIDIMDPNNVSPYGGNKTITFDEFYNAMQLVNGGENCWIISYGMGEWIN